MKLEIEKAALGDEFDPSPDSACDPMEPKANLAQNCLCEDHGNRRRVIIKMALSLVVSLPVAGALNQSADASLADGHRLKSEICGKYVSASAVWSDRRQARSQSLKKWDHKVRLRYGDRFASWDTAQQRRTRESYDLIDGNWYVTRIARPCEAQVLTKR